MWPAHRFNPPIQPLLEAFIVVDLIPHNIVAAGNLSDHINQLSGFDILGAVGRGAGPKGVQHLLNIVIRGEQNHRRIQLLGSDLAGHLKSVHIRNVDVNQGHPRSCLSDQGDGLIATHRLSPDLDVVLIQENVADPFAEEWVVLNNEYGDLLHAPLRSESIAASIA